METASGSRGFVTTNEKRTVLEELNKGFRFYLRDEISKPEVIDLINEFSGVEHGSFGDIFKLEESNDLVLSACMKYPAASKNEMLSKLYQYFNGSVSKDSIKRWIKNQNYNRLNQISTRHFH